MQEPQKILELQETMIMDGVKMVRARYMGGNMMLLSGEIGVQAIEFVEANKEWLRNFFEAFEPWKPNMNPGHRLAWNKDGLGKALSRFRTLVSLVDETKEMAKLQYARALVRTSATKPIHEFLKAKINGIVCDIRFVEEVCGGCCQTQKAVDDEGSIWSRISGKEEDCYFSEEVEEKIQHERVEETSNVKMIMEKEETVIEESLMPGSHAVEVVGSREQEEVTKCKLAKEVKRNEVGEIECLREVVEVRESQQSRREIEVGEYQQTGANDGNGRHPHDPSWAGGGWRMG